MTTLLILICLLLIGILVFCIMTWTDMQSEWVAQREFNEHFTELLQREKHEGNDFNEILRQERIRRHNASD